MTHQQRRWPFGNHNAPSGGAYLGNWCNVGDREPADAAVQGREPCVSSSVFSQLFSRFRLFVPSLTHIHPNRWFDRNRSDSRARSASEGNSGPKASIGEVPEPRQLPLRELAQRSDKTISVVAESALGAAPDKRRN